VFTSPLSFSDRSRASKREEENRVLSPETLEQRKSLLSRRGNSPEWLGFQQEEVPDERGEGRVMERGKKESGETERE
jgi:hypothetical protein